MERYWEMPRSPNASSDPSRLRSLLAEAVSARLVSDVPVGAFLSGGVDSTAIVALASHASPSALSTFSVTFGEASEGDRFHSKLVAERFRTNHTELHLESDEIVSLIPQALGAQDHPSMDGVNTWLVSRATRGAGLSVALSGVGSDELFGGYPSFRSMARQQRMLALWRLLPMGPRKALASLIGALRPSIWTWKLGEVLESDGSIEEVLPVSRKAFLRRQIEEIIPGAAGTPDPYVDLMRSLGGQGGVFHTTSLGELSGYLQNVLLRDTDQFSMAHALEVRVPFLDHHVVEHVLGVRNADYGRPKGYLLDAVGDLLPTEVVNRPKQGFDLPFATWMHGPLKSFCTEALEALAATDGFDGAAIRRRWMEFESGSPVVSWSRIWLLVSLGVWVDQNITRFEASGHV